MRDIVLVTVSVAFFLLSIGYVKFCDRFAEGDEMTVQSVVMLAITILTMAYLFYALLRPEKF